MHRLARDNAWRLDFDAHVFGVFDRALAVDWVAERVNDAAEQALTNRYVHNRACALDRVALADRAVITENNDTNIVVLEVQGHALDAPQEFNHFTSLNVVQAVDPGDTITHG